VNDTSYDEAKDDLDSKMIERIRIQYYRCFEDFTLDLKGLSSALIIGKNGSGKSVFIQALRVIRGLFRQGTLDDLLSVDDFFMKNKDVPICFEIDFKLYEETVSYSAAISINSTSNELQFLEEEISINGRKKGKRLNTIFKDQFGKQTVFNSGASILHAFIPQISNELLYHIQNLMLLSVSLDEPKQKDQVKENLTLNDNGMNVESVLTTLLSNHPSAYNTILNQLKKSVPDFDTFSFQGTSTGKQVLVSFVSQDYKNRFQIAYDSLSNGEKCYFISALILAINKHVGPVFCFWDEPEKHIALPEIDHFILDLRKMPNGQFLAASHNQQTIRSFSQSSTFVFKRDTHLEATTVKKLTDFDIDPNRNLIEAIKKDDIL
jgi:predicted ATPase